jgi:hypothetical protein
MENGKDAAVTRLSLARKALAAAVAVVAISYLALIIRGTIEPKNRLTAAELGVVVVAALAIGVALKPGLVDRLQKFDFGGIKFELGEVKKGQIEVQKNQQEQQAVLEDVQLALQLLIGDNERDHLKNLHKHATSNYRVKGALRDEIRRLRAMRLLKMRKGKTVGSMPDNATFDLADYVELTEDGLKFVSRLNNQAASATN